MRCPRCHGLMVVIQLEDAMSTAGGHSLYGWRCLLCGEVLDSGIEGNRKGHARPRKDSIRRPFGVMLRWPVTEKPRKATE